MASYLHEPSQVHHLMGMVLSGSLVGTSRPARAAALLRAISIRFIRPGRARNCEEDFNDAEVRAAQGRALGVTKISALDQILA